MPITIGSNIASLNVQRRLARATDALSDASERLSSGMRITKPSDDAAGLAIASSLTVDARVFAQGIRNINDGISVLNIAEGALNELTNITLRQKELAEQAANGSYSFTQRKVMNLEANALVDEYNRIVNSTTFNGRQVLTASNNELRIQAGIGNTGSIGFALGEELDRTVGDGTFNSANFQPGGTGSFRVSMADVNQDGVLDLISASNTSGTVDVMIGNGNGTFLANVSYTALASTAEVEVADFNGDGVVDLLAVNNATISVLIGNGNGTFKAQATYNTGVGATGVGISDFNGDGFLDAVAVNNTTLDVLFGNGNGSFKARVTYSLSAGESLALGDVNNDNITDVISGSTNSFTLFIGKANGTFNSGVSFVAGAGVRGTSIADVDGDGYQDVITADRDDNTLSIFRGNGNGTFLSRTTVASYVNPREVLARDINGDGFIDLLSADFTSSVASVYLGNGDGTFASRRSYGTGSGTRGLALGDVNNDGLLDLAAANFTGSTVNVLLGNGQDVVTISRLNLYTQSDARTALDLLDTQLTRISKELASIGGNQSRFAVAARNLAVGRENYLSAASRISDVDVAQETSQYVQNQIVQQVAASILAQANQVPALALRLLK